MAELAQLQRGERGLQRSAPADDEHLFDAAGVQGLQRVVGDVGSRQDVGVGDQYPRHVQRDVAVAHDDSPPGRQVRCHFLEMGVRVVPAHEVDGRHAAVQVLAGDAQRPVGLRADGVDHRVVAFGQLGGMYVVADHDVAEEPEPRVQRRLLELGADRLDLRMVGRNTGTHQPPRCGQHLQHVDADIRRRRLRRRRISGARRRQSNPRGLSRRSPRDRGAYLLSFLSLPGHAQGAVASWQGCCHLRC